MSLLLRSAEHWILCWMIMDMTVRLMKLASKGCQGHVMVGIMMKV
uniref:Uncharacterized protein n=1 Tax=Arundo donax TaxID=35708 RepID=A0A0A8ZQJ3_ARUDO